MKIIEQSHEILAYDGLGLIELAGRTCYKSEDKVGCTLPDEAPDCTWPTEDAMWDEDMGCCAQSDCLNHSAVRCDRWPIGWRCLIKTRRLPWRMMLAWSRCARVWRVSDRRQKHWRGLRVKPLLPEQAIRVGVATIACLNGINYRRTVLMHGRRIFA